MKFILVLTVNGTENRGIILMTQKVLIASIIAQIIMTLVSISIALNAEHR